MTIRNVLVVDDSKTELAHLTDVLTRGGFAVRTAENGDDAMRRLEEEKPDLILMDVVMPGRNGFQLTRAITKDPRWSDVPIIMCTSKNQETDRVWGMRQGARDYVVKPVDSAELLGKIRAFG
jgi:twitching motility two-component system response regulator PilH